MSFLFTCAHRQRLSRLRLNSLDPLGRTDHLPFPTSNRDFTFLIITIQLPPTAASVPSPSYPTPEAAAEAQQPPRSFVVISVPVTTPKQPGWVRAKYVSVEKVDELEGGRGVKWT